MRFSLPKTLCAGRMAQTGEGWSLALSELSKAPPGIGIPEAATADQASLESDFLEIIGRCNKDRWKPHMLPFAIKSVTPRPDKLVVRIPREYLPDIIREVMPKWSAEDGEVDGIPGLRARFHRSVIILRRPGLTGQIAIPSTASRWHKALMIAAGMCGQDPTLRLPWLTRQDEWDAAEIRHVESWPGRYSTDGWHYRNTRFASQILRRLPGLHPGPRPYFHSLWFNRFGDTCGIQFEWAFGASHKDVLGRLLDPVFGPGAEIALLEGQTLDDCFTDSTYQVNVRCVRQPDCWISLRRMTWEKRETDANLGSFGEERRSLRAAIETKYGY